MQWDTVEYTQKEGVVLNFVVGTVYLWTRVYMFYALVPAFSEFFISLVFIPFKPFLLRVKGAPPTLVIIMRLGFSNRSLLRYKPVHFTAFLVSFLRFIFNKRSPTQVVQKSAFWERSILKPNSERAKEIPENIGIQKDLFFVQLLAEIWMISWDGKSIL